MLKKAKNNVLISVIAVFCAAILTVVMPVQASSFEEVEIPLSPNVGVSFESPETNPAARGISRPSKVWNIKEKGKYSFSGSSNHKTMYTNYKFTGKTSYKVYVKNTGNNAITVKAKRLTKTYGSTKISAGKTGIIEFSNIKSGTKFYVTFDGAKDDKFSFEGYVK